MTGMVNVRIEDVQAVLAAMGRTSQPGSAEVAAANRLRDAIAPSLFGDPSLSDPTVDLPGQAHARAGEVEQLAAWRMTPKTGTQRRRVLEEFVKASGTAEHGLTDDEVALRTGIYLYSAAPRRVELMRGGWVRDSGRRRPTPRSETAVVWTLTDEALSRLAPA